MTVITTYTSYAEVRASLGVEEKEVDDITLALPMYANHLDMEFSDLEDGLSLAEPIADTFATLTAIGAGSRTRAQSRMLANTSLFATYAVARHLGTSLGMLAPKSIGDGKALMTRFTDNPYKVTLERVEAQYEKAKDALTAALDALNSTTTAAVTTPFFGVASPATDPVVE